MEYNIINTYLKFIKDNFLKFFKIVLGNKYQKSMCEIFIDRYIDLRYNDETNYREEKDFINRLNMELLDIYKDNVDENNVNTLKTIVALFGYLTYLDDLYLIKEDIEVINTLVSDEDLKISKDEDLLKDVKTWYINLKRGKENFAKTLTSKEFYLTENSVYRKTYEVNLEHNVKISNLFSEYAINKAYNNGTVAEDKLFITYIMTSYNVLNNAINLDFTKRYIVDFASTLFKKEKKILRMFNALDSSLAKKFISIKITYKDYVDNKNFINSKIKEGFSFSVVLEDDDVDLNELILFNYIYVFEDSEIFDIISNGKDRIHAKIIKL